MATPRLPVPGQDDGTWGDILNDFLRQAHDDDGSLKALSQDQVTGLTQALADKAAQADLDALATTVTGKVDTTDGRLTDARVPLDGSVTDAKVSSSAAISADKLADGTVNKVLTATQKNLLSSATILDTASSLVTRDANGRTNFQRVYSTAGPPTLTSELTRKDYVDYGDSHPRQTWYGSNTTSAQIGYWFRIGAVTITTQYADWNVQMLLTSTGSGTGQTQQATVSLRVKQQPAMGAAPYIGLLVSDLRSDGSSGWTAANFMTITETNSTTSTVVGLWVQNNQAYSALNAYEQFSLSSGGSASFAYSANSSSGVVVGALPSGTQLVASYAPNDAMLAGASSTNAPSTLVSRDSNGNSVFWKAFANATAPTVSNELTRKDYVDAFGSLSTATSSTPGAAITPTAAWLPSTQVITLTANATIGVLPTSGGQLAGRAGTITLNLIQATGTGPFTITWPSGIKWAQGAAAPAMPSTAGARLIVNLFWDGVSQWFGMVAGSF